MLHVVQTWCICLSVEPTSPTTACKPCLVTIGTIQIVHPRVQQHLNSPLNLPEMEYSGVNSEDQTDIAEMLNSFFTEVGPSLVET